MPIVEHRREASTLTRRTIARLPLCRTFMHIDDAHQCLRRHTNQLYCDSSRSCTLMLRIHSHPARNCLIYGHGCPATVPICICFWRCIEDSRLSGDERLPERFFSMDLGTRRRRLSARSYHTPPRCSLHVARRGHIVLPHPSVPARQHSRTGCTSLSQAFSWCRSTPLASIYGDTFKWEAPPCIPENYKELLEHAMVRGA